MGAKKGHIHLCINCLSQDQVIIPVAIGPEHGTQRDPWRDELDLCVPCGNALMRGDISAFHKRYTEKVLIIRQTEGG